MSVMQLGYAMSSYNTHTFSQTLPLPPPLTNSVVVASSHASLPSFSFCPLSSSSSSPSSLPSSAFSKLYDLGCYRCRYCSHPQICLPRHPHHHGVQALRLLPHQAKPRDQSHRLVPQSSLSWCCCRSPSCGPHRVCRHPLRLHPHLRASTSRPSPSDPSCCVRCGLASAPTPAPPASADLRALSLPFALWPSQRHDLPWTECTIEYPCSFANVQQAP
mmetsp:Transcript_43561/g.83132  ORF Transcript_43561/g.83132 Transcript_43561/m.83132 type:complete len:217 (-) Transcript_43561:187-837(-)